MKKEIVDMKTGEITNYKLNELIHIEERRPDGSLRVAWDYSNCPTMAEQHTAHLTNINYLMEKYQPDELAAYLAARNQYRMEILNHDFSQEPDLQEAMNIVARSRTEFDSLPDDVKINFKNHVEFLKFIDNPANAEKMLKLGILTPRKLENLKADFDNPTQNIESSENQNTKSKTKNKSED